jgi:hypothetical protein
MYWLLKSCNHIRASEKRKDSIIVVVKLQAEGLQLQELELSEKLLHLSSEREQVLEDVQVRELP